MTTDVVFLKDTPIYTGLVKDQVANEAVLTVRRGMAWCPTCNRMMGDKCRTATGKLAVRDHTARYR